MIFQVGTAEKASEALSYFNWFHDSFVESILLTVTPDSEAGFGFALPVRYEVTLTLAHSNYASAEADGGGQRRIEVRLGEVSEMRVGNMIPVDNMIQECLIEVDEDGGVHLDMGGDGLIVFVSNTLTIQEIGRGGRGL